MKYGVLTFSYRNVKKFRQLVEDFGFFSMNLGDYMQTIAIRNLYRNLGIPDDETVDVDRDSMASYEGEPVLLVMNGVFFEWSFPIPDSIIPVFIGFHASEKVIKNNLDFFKRYEPIGCRDTATASLFAKYGVEAFTSGCLTMTFERRPEAPEDGKLFIVCGEGAGAFPADALRFVPETMLESAQFVFQRKIVHDFPLTEDGMRHAETYAGYLLNSYRQSASRVLTSLHHAATPSISSGIPTIICRAEPNPRFSFLTEFVPVYTPDRFAEIDWAAPAPDIEPQRTALLEKARTMLRAAADRL